MQQITIKGIPFDFDMMDANCADKYETANDVLVKSVNAIDTKLSSGDQLREQCKIVRLLLSTVLGDNAPQQLLGDSCNARDHLDVYQELINAVNAQSSDFITMAKQTARDGNRAQRRAKSKK